MKNVKCSLLAMLLLASLAAVASAEVVVLQSGKMYEGKIIRQDDKTLTIKTRVNIYKLNLSDIVRVESAPTEPTYKNVSVSKNLQKTLLGSRNEVDETVFTKKKSSIDFFVTSWCPYCRQMEAFLKQEGIYYTKYDIEKDALGQRKYTELGVKGVPVLVVGETVIKGYDPQGVLAAVKAQKK